MKPVAVSITVDRPREEVYAHLDVLANHEAFTDHILRDWELSGPATGVGARVKMTVKAPGRSERVELTVIEAQEPSTIVERTVGAGGKRVTRGTYRLAEAGPGRTRVEFEIAGEAIPPAERLLNPLTRAWLRKQNARAMERLKAQLEAAPARAAA
jgi:carbon monoxide dehydrogenase subunit G